jgi:hypothetical protein
MEQDIGAKVMSVLSQNSPSFWHDLWSTFSGKIALGFVSWAIFA